MNVVNITKDPSGRIVIASHYDPLRVRKIKTIQGHRWHPDKKHWSFPNTDGTLKKILKIFEGEKIHIDPLLDAQLSTSVIARRPERSEGTPKQSHNPPIPPLAKGGEGGFEDLRRELISRKYSYNTVKGYIYFNRDFLNFSGKSQSDINETDIKDYLLYLAEEKQSATSTLNQAILPLH